MYLVSPWPCWSAERFRSRSAQVSSDVFKLELRLVQGKEGSESRTQTLVVALLSYPCMQANLTQHVVYCIACTVHVHVRILYMRYAHEMAAWRSCAHGAYVPRMRRSRSVTQYSNSEFQLPAGLICAAGALMIKKTRTVMIIMYIIGSSYCRLFDL